MSVLFLLSMSFREFRVGKYLDLLFIVVFINSLLGFWFCFIMTLVMESGFRVFDR